MSMIQNAIKASANSDHVEFGAADIRSFSSQAIVAKSLKSLGLFWGLALICVFLPVVHFVLVPLFFILGIVFAVRARKLRYEIISGQILCPNCKSPMTIKNVSFAEDHKEICQNCVSAIKITPTTATSDNAH